MSRKKVIKLVLECIKYIVGALLGYLGASI